MTSPKDYWDQVYKEKPFKKGKAPSPFLVEMLPRLEKGKVLDLAMGEGQNAVYLAQKGFKVHGIDVSNVGVENALALARDTGVELEAKAVDLDLFVFNLFEYETVVMSFFKPQMSRYYSEIVRTLKQGGTLLIESHSMDEVKNDPNPEDPNKDYYYNSNEILRNFKGLRILYYNEFEKDGHYFVHCLARKPLDKDAVKYGFDIASKPKEEEGKSAQHKLAEALFKKK